MSDVTIQHGSPERPRPIALRRREAATFCGLSLSTWDRLRGDGRLPAPRVERTDARNRARILLWLMSDLEAWVAAGMPDQAKRAKRDTSGDPIRARKASA